jgi:phosphoglycerol transferase MdoB-like AlkP superfamily enzyme
VPDKNLIFITAEGFDTIAIDPALTPTLYKMANNSFVFTNFYNPIFLSTTDGEYMNMNSLIPKEGEWSMKTSASIKMPFAIGNMFNKLGYATNAYHNGHYKYYSRNLSHPNLGFKFLACGNGLQKRMNCKHWPNSDQEMIEATYYDYINENTKNFATYYMTISGHLNYNFGGNNMASRNKDLVKDLPYSDAVKAYIACNIELDRAMESLLKHLEEAGILNDTLIVISTDHYPYGLTAAQINEVSTFNRDDTYELYHSTLIMYNTAVEKIVIDKYASSIDILPTVYNLFGLNYDSRLLMGRDLLNENEDGLIILSNRSWKTEKGEFDSISKTFTPNEGVKVNKDYIDKINEIVYQKFSMSSLILSNDYYSKLGL